MFNLLELMFYLLELLKDFSLVFLPLLVAMDPLAILPFLVPFLRTLSPQRRIRVINVALITGLAIGLLFLGLGGAFSWCWASLCPTS
jgi:small neutral amino acid transporter SnatA (MarC family)